MRLRELEAYFTTWRKDPSGQVWHSKVETLAEAHGVAFLCPKCFAQNGGPVGTETVCCWFVGKVPDEAFPRPGRWTPSGTGIDDLTLHPSVNLDVEETRKAIAAGARACLWHGHVTNGDAA